MTGETMTVPSIDYQLSGLRDLVAFRAVQTIGPGLKTIRLCPAGNVESANGAKWIMDRACARALIDDFEKHGTELVIDFEHQTLGGKYASPNGRAPAAGWIVKLFYNEGPGLQALARWNAKAATMIKDREYQYISPVFGFAKDHPDRPCVLHSAGLTNVPAIPGMEKIAAKRIPNAKEVTMDGETKPILREQWKAVDPVFDELNKALEAKGVDMAEVTDLELLLKAAVEFIKAAPDVDANDTEGAGDDIEIANSVRETLGLPDGADAGKTLVAFSKLCLQASTAESKQQDIREFLAPYVLKGAMGGPDDTSPYRREDYADMVNLAAFNRTLCERVLCSRVKSLPPQGRTTPPTAEQMKRANTIHDAKIEFQANAAKLSSLTNMKAFVNRALTEEGLAGVDAVDVRAYGLSV